MEFIYEVVTTNGTYYYDNTEDLYNDFSFKGWTDGNKKRKELCEQPMLWDALGPMYGGIKEGKTVIRYETQEVYNILSQ